jgi:hypothetical protein
MPFTEYVQSSSYVIRRDSDHSDRGTLVTFPTKSGEFTTGSVKGFKVSLYPGILLLRLEAHNPAPGWEIPGGS